MMLSMSRPSLVVIGLLGMLLFLAGGMMILRWMAGEPANLNDPAQIQMQAALYANGGGVLLFSIYYFAIASGAVLVCTSFTALFFRRRS